MTIYVDPLFATQRTAKWPYTQACHLFTDEENLAHLHEMALELGIRQWFQQHKTLPHYDLVPTKRRDALRLGAVEVSNLRMKEILLREVALRQGKRLCAARRDDGKPCLDLPSHVSPSGRDAYCEAHCRCAYCSGPIERFVLDPFGRELNGQPLWVCRCYADRVSLQAAKPMAFVANPPTPKRKYR